MPMTYDDVLRPRSQSEKIYKNVMFKTQHNHAYLTRRLTRSNANLTELQDHVKNLQHNISYQLKIIKLCIAFIIICNICIPVLFVCTNTDHCNIEENIYDLKRLYAYTKKGVSQLLWTQLWPGLQRLETFTMGALRMTISI